MRNQNGALIKQIHDAMEKNANNELRKTGLTLAQVHLLMLLREQPEKQLPFKDLEKQFKVAQSTIAGLMKRLEQKGFVQCFLSEFDKRIKIAKIAPKGLEVCESSEKAMKTAEQQLLRGLSEEEKAQLWDLLQRLCKNLEDMRM